jgi:hypothetical protein
MGIDGRGVNKGPESKVGDASRWGNISRSNVGSDRSAQMVAEAEANKIVHVKKSGTDRGADSSKFQSSIAGATREMVVKAAINSAELERRESSRSRLARQLKE